MSGFDRRRVAAVLRSRPGDRVGAARRRRRTGSSGGGLGLRPGRPRVVTVLVSIALTLVGLSCSVRPIGPIVDLLASNDVDVTDEQAWSMLVASPLLLTAGCLLRGL